MVTYGVCAPQKPAKLNNEEYVRPSNKIEHMFKDNGVIIKLSYT